MFQHICHSPSISLDTNHYVLCFRVSLFPQTLLHQISFLIPQSRLSYIFTSTHPFTLLQHTGPSPSSHFSSLLSSASVRLFFQGKLLGKWSLPKAFPFTLNIQLTMPFPLQQVGSWISFTVMTQTLPGRFETEQSQLQNYYLQR